ncbi:phorbol-12-myristate-13-acetate-induced protein 1, partial [Tachysurus ichikawai]
QSSVLAECALQLRTLGDLLNWKYMLLEFLRTDFGSRSTVDEVQDCFVTSCVTWTLS